MTLTLAQTRQIGKDLTATGMKATVHGSNAHDDFVIEIVADNHLAIFPGRVDFKHFPNVKHSAAVLWVDEEKRTITEDISVYRGTTAPLTEQETKNWISAASAGSRFPVALPEGTTYKVIEGPVKDASGRINMKVTASAPASKLTLLVGRDDGGYHFVCSLPKRVDNVVAAYDCLRPKNVPEGSPRQGEWFFVPATDKQKTQIEQLIAKHPDTLMQTWLGDESVERGGHSPYISQDAERWNDDDTSHAALQAVVIKTAQRRRRNPDGKIPRRVRKPELFVCGYIVDDRGYRDQSSHHAPLWLEDWHKVVRNLEIPMGDDADSWD